MNTDKIPSIFIGTIRPIESHISYQLSSYRPQLLDNPDIQQVNRSMRVPKDRPERINSRTKHWERHVLAEVFSVPLIALEYLKIETHHLRIFSTRHGLALLAPQALLKVNRPPSCFLWIKQVPVYIIIISCEPVTGCSIRTGIYNFVKNLA